MNYDLYKILEIDNNSSKEDIKKAYYKLSKKYHPDKNNDIDANDKFNKIHSAYEILINDELKNEYKQMNELEKSNFIIILEKILGQEININELKNFGIVLHKNDIDYLENNFIDFFKRININEVLDLFKGVVKKKEFNNYSESSEIELNIYDEHCAEYYYQLPIYINCIKQNNLNIKIELNINIFDIIKNNKKEIKIKRKINDDIVTNTFIFLLNKPFVVYYGFGDVINNEYGNLIIKLNLCIKKDIVNNLHCDNNIDYDNTNYNNINMDYKLNIISNNISNLNSNLDIIWYDNAVILEKNITLYQFINGFNININLINYNLLITNWIPYRDGLNINIVNELTKYYNKEIKNLTKKYNLNKEILDIIESNINYKIIFNINFKYSKENLNLLLTNFN